MWGQINWKCHQDWTQGSLPWNQDTGLSFRTSALAATSPWTVSGPLAFLPTGQLGAWQGEDSPRQSRGVVILGLGGGARKEGLRLM